MKKYVKQVKKGLAALLAVVMVLGVYVPVMANEARTVVWEADSSYINKVTVHGVTEIVSTRVMMYEPGWQEEIEIAYVSPGAKVEVDVNFDAIENYLRNVEFDYKDFYDIGYFDRTDPRHITLFLEATFIYYDNEAGNWEIAGGSPLLDDYVKRGDIDLIGVNGNVLTFTMNSGVLKTLNMYNTPVAIHVVDNGQALPEPAQPQTSAPPTSANNQISVTINGTAVNFADQQPTNIDGRVLVPVRGVFETLGFDVSWNQDLRQATLARANDTIVITLDSATFTTNGVSHTLDVPAQSIGDRTMIPLRAVLESVGYELAWDGNTETVIISTN